MDRHQAVLTARAVVRTMAAVRQRISSSAQCYYSKLSWLDKGERHVTALRHAAVLRLQMWQRVVAALGSKQQGLGASSLGAALVSKAASSAGEQSSFRTRGLPEQASPTLSKRRSFHRRLWSFVLEQVHDQAATTSRP